MLKDGKLNAYWVQCNNNMQAAPNMNEEGYPGYRNPDNFIVVSDAYPTVTAAGRRPDPADRHVGREGGRLRQRRAPDPVLAPAGASRRARRARTSGSSSSSPSASPTDEVWPADCWTPDAGVQGQDPLRGALRQRTGRTSYPNAPRLDPHYDNHESELSSATTSRRACSRSTPPSGAATPTTWRPSTLYHADARAALARGRRQGDQVALPRGLRPLRGAGIGPAVLWQARQAAIIYALPYEPPAESPDEDLRSSGWSPGVCSSTGTPAP